MFSNGQKFKDRFFQIFIRNFIIIKYQNNSIENSHLVFWVKFQAVHRHRAF